jgi:histidine triad (HIT) family protein
VDAGECPFCAIVAGRRPVSLVLEAARVIAFAGLRQHVKGHVLIVPRRHVETIYDLDTDDAAALMTTAVTVARAVRAAFAPQGLSLWQSNGPAAFQEVPHVHLHVQPRLTGDGMLEIYPQAPVDAPRAELDDIAARVRAALADDQPAAASA